jgi:hypothetical protein
MGRDCSRRKQFLSSIRCQTSFRLLGTVKADDVACDEIEVRRDVDPRDCAAGGAAPSTVRLKDLNGDSSRWKEKVGIFESSGNRF